VCWAASPASAGGTLSILNRQIEPGQVFANALRQTGVTAPQAEAIVGALTGIFDFRRSRAGDQFRLVFRDRLFERLDYRQSAFDEWQVRQEGERLVATKREIGIEKKIETVNLAIGSSVYEAVLAAREDPTLALSLADVFAWDIDFYQDVRRGDRARLVVEKFLVKGRTLRYGELLAASYRGEMVKEKRVFRYQLPGGEVSYFQQDGSSARKAFLKSPLKYANITSRFGGRFHPILQYVKAHNGVDYRAPVGTPVWAVCDGVVTRAGTESGAGKLVCIRHLNALETCYLHLSGFGAGVRMGARVSQKQVIAYSGNTGLSTGPHLHFALKRGGHFVNPLNQKFPRANPVPKAWQADYAEKIAPYLATLDAVPVAAAGLVTTGQ
jgi:murein DD-endopeptidase MepM/ murein hydrolase activator NlpD